MGHYTNYKISILNNTDKKLTAYIKTELEDLSNNYFDIYNLSIESSESIKWYSYEKDINEVSKLIPDNIILVEGDGEEPRDIWRYYVKNGKGVRLEAVITFPEFTENMLAQ